MGCILTMSVKILLADFTGIHILNISDLWWHALSLTTSLSIQAPFPQSTNVISISTIRKQRKEEKERRIKKNNVK